MQSEGLTYLTDEKLLRIESVLHRLGRAGLPGHYLEFGVALGGSAVVIAKHARNVGQSFEGFDVFGMIPAPASVKDDEKSKSRYQTIKSGGSVGLGGKTYYGYQEDLYRSVCETFRSNNLDLTDGMTKLTKGLFEDTLPQTNIETICFAHVDFDCDWYDPVKLCLDYIAPRMCTGGVIVIDDYHAYGGCRTATDEFLAANPGFELKRGDNPFLEKTA
ncbi:TylF/MycF/NovP-related O-methyltransferase [uncultured Tateyamaria sp.]|uniref:TylF/MycF/NovP-related O-methyltransferase n=1 Tax=uncultured Tateyamaria sp. TaxID=455651 RepID=UPI0034267BEC